MDIETYGLLKKRLEGADAAAERANTAAEAAEQAISDIYHDKSLIWTVDPTDNHVVLTYYAETEE